LAELYRRRVAALNEALADPDTRDVALSLLRGLIERVVMTPVDGGFTVDLTGDSSK